MKNNWPILLTAVCSIIASSGFWSWIQHKTTLTSATERMIKGLAHERIVCVGNRYIRRGWISTEEFDDFMIYLYDPYVAMGGNGAAQRVFAAINKLPDRPPTDKE